jgi:hypothetical protein
MFLSVFPDYPPIFNSLHVGMGGFQLAVPARCGHPPYGGTPRAGGVKPAAGRLSERYHIFTRSPDRG